MSINCNFSAQSLSNPLNIHFGLLLLEGRILLFTLLPDNTGGVKRARALVHSRAVGAKLNHQATVTVTRPADLTLNAVRSKLKLDTGSASSSLPPSPNPQLSAGTSIPSPYLQPSPLRSQFQNGSNSPETGDRPPPPPDKDIHTLSKMRSSNSMRSPNLSTPPFSPPTRQSSREPSSSTPPQHGQYQLSPRINGQQKQPFTNGQDASHNQPAVGLGIGNSASSQIVEPAPLVSLPNSQSLNSVSSISPRLASLEFEREHRKVGSHGITINPPLAGIAEKQTRQNSQPPSPAASIGSAFSAHRAQRPQDLPLPASAGHSAPTSARSLDPSTLDSMFQPSDSQENLNEAVLKRNSLSSSSGYKAGAEQIAIAEAIARAAEQKWKDEQNAMTRNAGEQHVQQRITSAASEDQVNGDGTEDQTSGQHHMKPDLTGVVSKHSSTEVSQVSSRPRQLQGDSAVEDDVSAPADAARIDAKRSSVTRSSDGKIAQSDLLVKGDDQAMRKEEEAKVAADSVAAEEEEAQRAKAQAEEDAERQHVEQARAEEDARTKAAEDEANAKAEAERARLEANEQAKREQEAVKQRAKDGLKERLQSSDPDETALTGFLSVQGGSSIVSDVFGLVKNRTFH